MATTTTEKSESKADKDAGAAAAAAASAAAERPRDPAREKAIDVAVSTIEKQFGKGSIMRLGEGMAPPEVKVVPTGSLGLDIALGVGTTLTSGGAIPSPRRMMLPLPNCFSMVETARSMALSRAASRSRTGAGALTSLLVSVFSVDFSVDFSIVVAMLVSFNSSPALPGT